jgi:hypothetical protein
MSSIWNDPPILSLTFSSEYYEHRNKGSTLIQVSYLAYTESINLLDYSAAVIPVTRADQDIDIPDKSYKPLSEIDRKNWEACKFCFSAYLDNASAFFFFFTTTFFLAILTSMTKRIATDDPEVYHGAPVGVQIVARKHEEEKVWAIACVVDRILRRAGYGFKLLQGVSKEDKMNKYEGESQE